MDSSDISSTNFKLKLSSTISFFGSGSPQVTGPIGDKIEIIKHCFPCKGEVCKNYGEGVVCIHKISKTDIEDAVKKLMII